MMPQLDYYNIGTGVKAFSSTRHGGSSKGNYAAFNINHYCGDSEDAIQINRTSLCQYLGISNDRLIMPHQVHETEVVMVDDNLLQQSADVRQQQLEGVDALMTNIPGVCIGVSTADCIPVLLFDPIKRIAAAIHAGWRGTTKRIVEKSVDAMIAAYGCSPQDVVAQIGPGIHIESFEVGDEVYEALSEYSMESGQTMQECVSGAVMQLLTEKKVVNMDNVPFRFIDLFAGIGGGIYGGNLLGHQCCAAVEIDEFCKKILK